MSFIPVALPITAVVAVLTEQQPVEVVIDGFVRDTENNPVKGVKVTLYPQNGRSANTPTRTNDEGRYELKSRVDSAYDLFFSRNRSRGGRLEIRQFRVPKPRL